MFTKFGFPLDIDKNGHFESDLVNHPSTTQFPDHVEHYIAEELKHGAFWVRLSTLPLIYIRLHSCLGRNLSRIREEL